MQLGAVRCRGHRAARDRGLLPLQALPAAQRSRGIAERAPGAWRVSHRAGRTVCHWKPDDGGEKWFCGDCGSAIFGRNPSHPDSIGIRMGTFDRDPGSGRASGRSSPVPRRGKTCPTTGCLVPAEPPRGTVVRTTHVRRARGTRGENSGGPTADALERVGNVLAASTLASRRRRCPSSGSTVGVVPWRTAARRRRAAADAVALVFRRCCDAGRGRGRRRCQRSAAAPRRPARRAREHVAPICDACSIGPRTRKRPMYVSLLGGEVDEPSRAVSW